MWLEAGENGLWSGVCRSPEEGESGTVGSYIVDPKKSIIPFALQSNYWPRKNLSPVLGFAGCSLYTVALLILSSILLSTSGGGVRGTVTVHGGRAPERPGR